MTLHLALIVLVPTFFLLGIWQLSRALHGNLLSWAYTFEWPFFACYAIWMWWRLVHEEPARTAERAEAADQARGDAGAAAIRRSATAHSTTGFTPSGAIPVPRDGYDPFDDEADPELAAYNRYLAELNAKPER